MSPFRFRLARVLRVRAIEEEVARARWLEALHAAEEAERRADGLARVSAAQDCELERMVSHTPIDARLVLAGRTVADRLSLVARRAREGSRTLAFQAEQQRSPWEGLRRARRSLELLREKKVSAHRLEDERREAHAMDAIAIERAARTHSRPGSPDRTSDSAP